VGLDRRGRILAAVPFDAVPRLIVARSAEQGHALGRLHALFG
jgi:hypothetical protein